MPTSATPYTFILCLTESEHDTNLLLVQRVFIQKRVDGRAVPGVIPHWAGQWGVITASPTQSQPIITTAYDTFLSQTGLNLADRDAAKPYEILRTETKTLQDSDYNPVPVLYVRCTPRGLEALTKAVQANIEAGKPRDGVLEMVAIKRLPEATTLLKPVLRPKTGWKQYLTDNYYGGKPPGSLNLDIGTLTQRLTTYSTEPPTAFSVVIENIPKSGVVPPVTTVPPVPQVKPGRLVALNVNDAEHTSGGIWYQSYAPGQSILLQAVTEPATPEVHEQIHWQGGSPGPSGHADLRTVSRDRLTPKGAPIIVQASLDYETKSVKVAVVPNLVALDVYGAEHTRGGIWYQSYAPGQSILLQAVTDPARPEVHGQIHWQGGSPGPSGHADLRTVSRDRLTPKGAPFIVQASLDYQTKSVKVAVVPNLLRFDVTGAQSQDDSTWGLDARGNTPAVVRAVVEPDTPEAYTFLTWSGGEVDRENRPDRRLVRPGLVRDPKNPLPVEVHIAVE
jgi:hypothetical protein